MLALLEIVGVERAFPRRVPALHFGLQRRSLRRRSVRTDGINVEGNLQASVGPVSHVSTGSDHFTT
jgi:hypothetical protein